MVQGSGAIVGNHIANHKHLNALVFTGSFAGATSLRKVMFRRPDVAVVYQTGGKGIAIVLNDADMEQAVYEVMVGAFLTAGMRHNSTGRVIVEAGIYDKFVANLVDRSGRISIGHAEETGVFMGPMISDGHRNRCRKYLSLLESQGHIPLLVGGRFEIEGQKGFYCAPSITYIDHKNADPCLNEPPHGPSLLVYMVEDAEEAVELHNRAVYRHTCSIFSKSRGPYGIEMDILSGGVNFNRATIGASRRLPSMGLGRASGHKQGGLGLLRSLTFPKAVLRETRPFDPTMAIPGTNWSESDIGDSLGADTEIEDPTVLNMNLSESRDW
jgi:acyl-CoA reductase-like NAD-dependent aldehyde dehydrogenase